MSKVLIWVKITRPHTLFASLSPILIGLIVASKSVELNWIIALATLVCGVSLQVLSNK